MKSPPCKIATLFRKMKCKASFDITDAKWRVSNRTQHFTSLVRPPPKQHRPAFSQKGNSCRTFSKVEGGHIILEAGSRGWRLSLGIVEDVRQPATLTHSCFSLPLFLLLFFPSLCDLRFPPKHIFDFI